MVTIRGRRAYVIVIGPASRAHQTQKETIGFRLGNHRFLAWKPSVSALETIGFLIEHERKPSVSSARNRSFGTKIGIFEHFCQHKKHITKNEE